MNKNKLFILILLLTLFSFCPAEASLKLPRRFSLILNYKVSGNLTEGPNIICQYSFTKKGGVYHAIDCTGRKHWVIIIKNGSNVTIGIPLYLDSAVFTPFGIFISEKNVGFPCKGTIQPGGFISGTCTATAEVSGVPFVVLGTFTASP